MTHRGFQALIVSFVLYLLMSPLGTYNTFALFGLVESRFVPLQLSVTAVMIFFAVIAGGQLGPHCKANPECDGLARVLWMIGFYVIGPPVLVVYYRLYVHAPTKMP